jgi:hypothetical protein
MCRAFFNAPSIKQPGVSGDARGRLPFCKAASSTKCAQGASFLRAERRTRFLRGEYGKIFTYTAVDANQAVSVMLGESILKTQNLKPRNSFRASPDIS